MSPTRDYVGYGLSLRSHWPLPCTEGADARLPTVELVEGARSLFSEASCQADSHPDARWSCYLALADGTEYLRWNRLFEFLVSADGHQVTGRPLEDASEVAFHTYLLGQVLSHVHIKLGLEPLHATAIDIGGEGIALLGDSGAGKSTLAASFVGTGSRLLTDDLLIVKREGRDFLAYPGIPRLKVFPEIARALLETYAHGTPMNPLTKKLVVPLTADAAASEPIRLRRLYALSEHVECPDMAVMLRPISAREACLELLKNTYNRDVVHPARLQRQLLESSRLALAVPLKRLSFPRQLEWLTRVREAILSDVQVH